MPVFLVFLIVFCGLNSYAQNIIHVSEEPYHKPVFKNEYFTVIELKMAKGDTSLFHLHQEPILYLTLTGAKMWLNTPEGEPRVVELPDGWMGSDMYDDDNSFVHQISVLDGGPLHLIAVLQNKENELKSTTKSDAFIYQDDGFAVDVDSVIPTSASLEKINIVAQGEALKENNSISPGDFFFRDDSIQKPSNDFKYYKVFFENVID